MSDSESCSDEVEVTLAKLAVRRQRSKSAYWRSIYISLVASLIIILIMFGKYDDTQTLLQASPSVRTKKQNTTEHGLLQKLSPTNKELKTEAEIKKSTQEEPGQGFTEKSEQDEQSAESTERFEEKPSKPPELSDFVSLESSTQDEDATKALEEKFLSTTKNSKDDQAFYVGSFNVILKENKKDIWKKNSWHLKGKDFLLLKNNTMKDDCIKLCNEKSTNLYAGFIERTKKCYCSERSIFTYERFSEKESHLENKLDVYGVGRNFCKAAKEYLVDEENNKLFSLDAMTERWKHSCDTYQKLLKIGDRKCLTIIIGGIRGSPVAWDSLFWNLLEPLQCDLMVVLGKNEENQKHCLWKLAKYKLEIPEYEDWGDYIREHINNSTD